MAWVSASIPVQAVRLGGNDTVSSGSAMTETRQAGCVAQRLTCAAVSVNMEAAFISAPVPAVVGIATTGGMPRLASPSAIGPTPGGGSRTHSKAGSGTPVRATIAMHLPPSRALPPPRATRPSAPWSRKASAPTSMSVSVGLARTPAKRRGDRPAPASSARTPLQRPLSASPRSVTSRGRVEPRSRRTELSSLTRPAPKRTGTGKSQSPEGASAGGEKEEEEEDANLGGHWKRGSAPAR
mmetsp:Transcript_102239/g.318454  ORF Transcript_102239/g.318454 Transcript_102239/m.318454 type:complete len:239 (-) Transcript_102239:99-815(-)